MKKIFMTVAAVILIAMTSCEKNEINPTKPELKDPLTVCKMCEGGWDLTDSIP